MANPDTGIIQTTTRGFERPAGVGQVADNHPLNRRRDVINTNPQAAQVDTLTVINAGEADYDLTVGGIDFTLAASVVSIAAAADALAVSWNADPILRGWMTADSDGIAVVTLTANNPGIVIDIVEAEANLTYASVTVAATADPVPFGRAMVAVGYVTPENNQLDPDGTMLAGVLADDALLTAQVDDWTIADPGIGQFIGATCSVVGLPGTVHCRVPWDTSLTVTLAALATVLNAALADRLLSSYLAVTSDATSLVFTAQIAGVEFESSVDCDNAAAYPVISASSNLALATSFLRRFIGASIRATDEVPSTIGSTSSTYGANRGVRVLADGPMWVASTEAPAYGDRVFVGTTTNEEGLFYKSSGTGRIPLPLTVARWLYSARSGEGDNVAVVRLAANV